MKKKQYYSAALLLGFLLGIRDGKIALWNTHNPEPVEIFPYRAEYLPEADRQALEQGIHINNEEALHHLLEDYLS